MATNALLVEMRALRDRVIGITDTALASRDGLIITADTTDIDPDNVAALAAASLGLAQRMAAETGGGTLRESMIRSSGGCVAVYAVGTAALLIVVGDAGLDSVRLDREARAAVEVINGLLPGARAGRGPRAAASLARPSRLSRLSGSSRLSGPEPGRGEWAQCQRSSPGRPPAACSASPGKSAAPR
jgi:predicted regulator of Ras-like GTPase activity (Roadblock/LC7/MglB family)